jgi:hypothetical protein
MKPIFHKINLNDFKLSNTKKIEKAISHIDNGGNLIKDKDYPPRNDIIDIDTLGSPKFEERKRKIKRTKAKRKTKGCGCK